MAIENFTLTPEAGDPDEQELSIAASAELDYETPASRKQRGLIVCNRAETSSVTAKRIQRGFVLDLTDVPEIPTWNTPSLPSIVFNVPANLAAQSTTRDFSGLARDDENNPFHYVLGTVPAGITASFNGNVLTVSTPTFTANPAENVTYNLPVHLEQPLGTKVTGSDRTLAVIVNRFAPRPIYSQFPSPASQARLYLDRVAQVFRVHLPDFIQNHDNRPLVAGHGLNYETTWSTAVADFSIDSNLDFDGTTKDPFPFTTTQTSNVVVRVRTDDVGDRSEVFVHYLLRTEVPAP